MKNVDQVRDRLSAIFDQLESGEIDAKKLRSLPTSQAR